MIITLTTALHYTWCSGVILSTLQTVGLTPWLRRLFTPSRSPRAAQLRRIRPGSKWGLWESFLRFRGCFVQTSFKLPVIAPHEFKMYSIVGIIIYVCIFCAAQHQTTMNADYILRQFALFFT